MSAISMPDYIAQTGIIDDPITYQWDDSTFDDVCLRPDERLGKRIHQIGDRAEVALALGFAEWLAWRISRYDDTRVLLQFIEAVWVGIVDWRYISASEGLDEEDSQGPVRGPICAAFNQLLEVVHLIETEQFAYPEIVCLSRIAEHVLRNPKSFKEWRQSTIERMIECHPKTAPAFWGDPVPRQILDPTFDYDPNTAPRLIDEFLRSVDYSSNPFLRTPQAMRDIGFEGIAYSYDPSKSQK